MKGWAASHTLPAHEWWALHTRLDLIMSDEHGCAWIITLLSLNTLYSCSSKKRLICFMFCNQRKILESLIFIYILRLLHLSYSYFILYFKIVRLGNYALNWFNRLPYGFQAGPQTSVTVRQCEEDCLNLRRRNHEFIWYKYEKEGGCF